VVRKFKKTGLCDAFIAATQALTINKINQRAYYNARRFLSYKKSILPEKWQE
jgi:hypothetical protein